MNRSPKQRSRNRALVRLTSPRAITLRALSRVSLDRVFNNWIAGKNNDGSYSGRRVEIIGVPKREHDSANDWVTSFLYRWVRRR